jgi:hypothetical protein
MATIQELRAQGALTAVATPIPEPLNAPPKFNERLKRFGDHYNLSNDSHLFRFLVALCGDTGAGSLKRELLLPRLQAQLESTHFLNLDRIYGSALLLPRLDAELYAYNPENDILQQQQWAEVYAKDASYRARCLTWMRAIIAGSTLEGMSLAAEAAIGVECDIFERYKYIENQTAENALGGGSTQNIGKTTSRNEFVIVPRSLTVSEQEKRRIMRLVDKLRPVNTLCTVVAGDEVRSERSFQTVAASSERFYVKRLVSGNTAISWPDVDISQGVWVESAIEKEAPTFAFMDRQEAVTYLDVSSVEASTEHVGYFNKHQRQLFGHLAESPDETYYYSADRSYARNIAPVNLATAWTRGTGEAPHDMIVVNNHYPIGYFADTDTSAFIQQPQENFWASVEEYAPASETLVFDFGRVRPINFIDFEICHKPVDFIIEYDDAGVWKTVEPREGLPVSMSVDYHPSLANPWHYFEITFDLLQTQKIRLTMTRRERRFPLETSELFPWSIELRSARLMYVIGRASDFIEDEGQDVLGNTFRTELDVKRATVISELTDDDASLTVSGTPITDAVRTASLAGDGREPEGTYGIWEATTNLLTNGGFEANATGWTGTNGTVARDNARAKFGTYSGRLTITASGSATSMSATATISGATAARKYSGSVWVYADSTQTGRDFVIILRETGGASGAAESQSVKTLAAGWNLLTHTRTIAQNDRTGVLMAVGPSSNAGNFATQRYWIDGAQIEEQPLITPYVDTSGSTQTRTAARVQLPPSLLDETQGWVAMRVRLGWDSTTEPGDAYFFDWRDGGSEGIWGFYNATGNSLSIFRGNGSGSTVSTAFTPSTAETTFIFKWSATQLGMAANGLNFVTGSNTLIPDLAAALMDIGQTANASHLDGNVLWFAAGTGELTNADATTIYGYGSTAPEYTRDLPGAAQVLWDAESNTYQYNTGKPDPLNYWSSKPNPSRHGVEALYFDLRQGEITGTMEYLNTQFMDELNERSMADLANYYADGQIIDEVYIDPVTYGCDMHFYYSDDDDPDWDEKLWTPIPRQYILKRGFFALPQPTYVRYFKIEFSNLAAMPYQAPEYPLIPVVQYNRFPSWVEDYFAMAYMDRPVTPDLLEVVEQVIIDPIKFGFQKVNDKLVSNFEAERILQTQDTDDEVSEYIHGILHTEHVEDRAHVESKIQFRSPLQWQSDLVALLDSSRALSRVAMEAREGIIDTGWSAELGLPIHDIPLQASTQNQTENIKEKQTPILWFPRRARHTYKIVEAPLTKKLAYFAAVKTVSFHRRNFQVYHDEAVYYESLSDSAHIESTDFVQNDWRYEIET